MGCNIRRKINFDVFLAMVGQHYEWFKNMSPVDELVDENLEVIQPSTDNTASNMNTPPQPQVISYPKFVIQKDCTILTLMQQKTIKCLYDKRRLVVSDTATVPVTVPVTVPATRDICEHSILVPVTIESVPLGFYQSAD